METNNRAYTSTALEVYKRETQEVVRSFLSHELSFPDCIAALHSALARLLPTLEREQFDEVRVVLLANNDAVMDEMARLNLTRVVTGHSRRIIDTAFGINPTSQLGDPSASAVRMSLESGAYVFTNCLQLK